MAFYYSTRPPSLTFSLSPPREPHEALLGNLHSPDMKMGFDMTVLSTKVLSKLSGPKGESETSRAVKGLFLKSFLKQPLEGAGHALP